MGRKNRAARRTPIQAAADRQSDELAARLGLMLRDARQQRRITQREASERAGLSPSTWSWLEIGRDGRVTLATVNRAAIAVGSSLNVYLKQTSAAGQPRDAVHLRNQELVIRTAAPGLWQALPEELIDREARTSRAADVLLHRAASVLVGQPACYALVEVWDWFDDVGAAAREWGRRLDAVNRYSIARMATDSPLPLTSGCWVVRATQRNRRLVNEHSGFFRSRFPGSAQAWLTALTNPAAPMPSQPALLWVTVKGDRIFPSRLG
ncbi:MAG: helix-turn-helix transcriptional regulator [Candidatus Limnocylindrales bacterium]